MHQDHTPNDLNMDETQNNQQIHEELPPPIIFIHLGLTRLPSYYRHSLYQAREKFKGEIVLICEQAGPIADRICSDLGIKVCKPSALNQSASHRIFAANCRADRTFRNGFWTYVIERFFVLEEYLQHMGLSRALHLEGDNLIFAEAESLIEALTRMRGAIAVPFDHDHRAVAGLFWVGNILALSDFTTFIAKLTSDPSTPILNDMDLLGLFRGGRPDQIDSLPVLPKTYAGEYRNLMGQMSNTPEQFSAGYEGFEGIFDANALGQYLDGVDPRNTGGQDSKGFINETAMHKYQDYVLHCPDSSQSGSIEPSIADKAGNVSRIINLHVHSKRLMKYRYFRKEVQPLKCITDVASLPDWDIITSERFQALADLTISDYVTYSTHYHPGHKDRIRTAIIDFNRFSDEAESENLYHFQHAEVLFIHSHLLNQFISKLLPMRIEPFVLISHASDHAADTSHISLANDVRLVHWFAQNCRLNHPKVTPIPIGLANANWPHGNLDVFHRARRRAPTRRQLLFCSHSLTTNSKRASKTISIIKNGFTAYDRAFEYPDYLSMLASSFYVASPEGNGMDCHRTWEALYCGAIPVVDKAAFYDSFEGLPILQTEDWSSVTRDVLISHLENIGSVVTEKLRMTYWAQQVEKSLRTIS